MISDKEKSHMYELVEAHGEREAVRLLRMIIRDRSHELSDMGLKEQAREAAEWADILSDLLVE
jgi:hypothetical protein